MGSPVNTSRLPSRTTAHDSGPEWLARPYSVRDFHPLFFASFAWRSKRSMNSVTSKRNWKCGISLGAAREILGDKRKTLL